MLSLLVVLVEVGVVLVGGGGDQLVKFSKQKCKLACLPAVKLALALMRNDDELH